MAFFRDRGGRCRNDGDTAGSQTSRRSGWSASGGLDGASSSEPRGACQKYSGPELREHLADPVHAFPVTVQQTPEQAELTQLCREAAGLKMERDILAYADHHADRHRLEAAADHLELQKSRGILRDGVDVKFGFVAKRRGICPMGCS